MVLENLCYLFRFFFFRSNGLKAFAKNSIYNKHDTLLKYNINNIYIIKVSYVNKNVNI